MSVAESRAGTARAKRNVVVLFASGDTHLVRPDGRRKSRAVALCGKRGHVSDVLPYRVGVCGDCRLIEEVYA